MINIIALTITFLLTIDPRYHTLSEIAAELDSIAHNYPEITMLDTIGFSTEDSLPIFAIKISDNAIENEDEPEILYVACHHAEEILGVEICMYMIDDLVKNYNIDSLKTYWINNRQIWIVPLLNPEGHSVVLKGIDTTWRKNKHDNNNNGIFDLDYDGVDPNRNYDFHWTEGGSNDPASEYYRGTAPFSENESRALQALCSNHNFIFCITYHSARTGLGEVVYYPYVWSDGYAPDFPIIRTIADTLSKLIINDAGTGHYTALPGQGLDGKARNWLYAICGIFTFCIEVSTTTIQPGWMVDGICQRNLVGAYYLMERVKHSAITGCIYDSSSTQPLSAEVIIEDYYDPDLPPRQSDPRCGRFNRLLLPGSYNLIIKKHNYETKYFENINVTNDTLTEFNIHLKKIENSIELNQNNTDILIYPNPLRKQLFTIELNNPEIFSSLKVYDLYGRLIKKFSYPFTNKIFWESTDTLGRSAAIGVYYIVAEYLDRLDQSIKKISKKFIIVD